MLRDDGDPVRALGFVLLYSGNLESMLTEELERIALARIVTVNPSARTLGGKVKELEKFVREYDRSNPPNAQRDERAKLQDLVQHLKDFTKDLRNPLVHGSIVSEKGKHLTLTDNGKKSRISSGDIYAVADVARDLHAPVMAVRFVLKWHLRARNIPCDFSGNRI